MANTAVPIAGRLASEWEFLRPYARSARVRLGFGVLLILVVLAVLSPVIGRYDPIAQDVGPVLQAPTFEHPFGTDNFGRDMFARVLAGGRSSLTISVATVALAMLLGVPLGLLAGMYRGHVDTLISRLIDMVQAFPSLILAISVVALLGPGLTNVILALGIVYAPSFARLARSGVLTVRELPYVAAARAIGDDSWTVLREQIVP